ncbi:hypothetical protein H9Q74_007198 [Fusarium xylarioides]|nr:hypothetical protein H9Q71_007304 [Fusarium xylarioides]KAG5822704.1 hypothetical protein H9Q74_007198 [Fusarium xylarioides]
MHTSSILMAAALYTSTVTGLATPQLSKQFSVPGASSEDGFTIPKGVQSGTYEVFIDDAGVAHHTRLEDADEYRVDKASANDDDSSLDRRQEGTGLRFITCGDSKEMNRGNTDDAVRDLVNQCGNSRQVQSGHHIYSVRGNVAVFYCNYVTLANSPPPFGVWGTPQTCYGDRVWNIIVSDISGKCGSFKPSWSEDVYAKQKNSVGYHEVGGDKNFCGEGHF